MNDKPELLFYLQVEDHFGTKKIVAHVGYLSEDGKIRAPIFGRAEKAGHLADFEVAAYVDKEHTGPWGFGYCFRPHSVELDEGESMVKILRKVRKGLERANEQQGWVPEGTFGFAQYLFRIAAVLNVKTFYTRNTDKQREMTGELFRRRDGGGVQYWLQEQVKEHCAKEES